MEFVVMIYYSAKKLDIVYGVVFLFFAICMSILAIFFLSDLFMSLIKKPINLLGILGFIFFTLLFVSVPCILYMKAYYNLFKKIEIVRLTDKSLIFSIMNGRFNVSSKEIFYTDFSKIYLKNTLSSEMIFIETNDSKLVPDLSYINSFLSYDDKKDIVNRINKIILDEN